MRLMPHTKLPPPTFFRTATWPAWSVAELVSLLFWVEAGAEMPGEQQIGLTSNGRSKCVRKWHLNTVGGGHADQLWHVVHVPVVWVHELAGIHLENVDAPVSYAGFLPIFHLHAAIEIELKDALHLLREKWGCSAVRKAEHGGST